MDNNIKVFNDESQIESIYINYMRNNRPDPEQNSGCPNRSDELTYEGFVKSADALTEPFSAMVEALNAN